MHTLFLRTLALAIFVIFAGSPVTAQQNVKTVTGSGFGGRFGSSIACVGDFNGDGFLDYVAGAPSDSTGATNSGAVFLISGANGSKIWSAFGKQVGEAFGYSVDVVADINNDGKGEIAVGSPYYNVPGVGADTGIVTILDGATGATIRTMTLNANGVGARLGFALRGSGVSISSTQSIPGVVVGAPYAGNNGLVESGEVHIFNILTGTIAMSYFGLNNFDHFGWAVTPLTVITPSIYTIQVGVGAPGFNSNTGRVYVRSAYTSGVIIKTIDGFHVNDEFGSALNVEYDYNGDSLPDLLGSAPGYSSNRGAVHCFDFNNGTFLGGFFGEKSGDQYGSSMSHFRYTSGGNKTGLVIGAPFATASFTGSGAVYIIDANKVQLAKVSGPQAGAQFGTAVSGASVWGMSDTSRIVGGAPGASFAANTAGRMEWLNTIGLVDHSAEAPSVAGNQLGRSVALCGDVNLDGIPDWAVGMPFEAHSYLIFGTVVTDLGAGRVDVVSGANGSTIFTQYGLNYNNLGWSVSGCGDVNHDGKPDIIAGAPSMDAGSTGIGGANIYSGANGALLRALSTGVAGDNFGSAVAHAGDLNLDTFSDVLVGAPKAAGPALEGGAVYAYSGANGTLLWTAKSNTQFTHFGTSVAGLFGDVNFDARPDVVVGSPATSNPSPLIVFSGAVYTLSGLNGTVLRTTYGLSTSENLGTSVAGVGDVDGDGLPDCVAGAPHFGIPNQFLVDVGAARLISGSTGNILNSFIGAPSDWLGWSVSGVGDVDNDGTPDFVAGCPQLSTIPGKGAIEVVSGRTAMRIVRAQGANTGDGYGYSVAGSVGVSGPNDFDADTLPDLMVGSPFADKQVYLSSGRVDAVSVRPLGVSFYGNGSFGCLGKEFFCTNASPKINSPNFGFHCNKTPSNTLGLILITDAPDLAGSDAFGVGIILNVGLLNATELYTFDIYSNGSGYSEGLAAIPNNPLVVGAHYYAQALWLWNICNLPPLNLSSSTSVDLTIQN